MGHLQRAITAVALALTGIGSAQALPELEVVFRDPMLTVGPSDTIEVWVTLSNVGSDALSFDTSSSEAPFGLDPAMLPTMGNDDAGPPNSLPFGSYDSISLFTYRYCNDEFSIGCGPGTHQFGNALPGAGWFDIDTPFELAAGASMDISLYTLVPVGGSAAPGVYSAFNMGLGLFVRGLAEDGVTALEADVFSAGTCAGSAPGCSFTVTVVPEPASALLLLAGLVPLLPLAARRRRRA